MTHCNDDNINMPAWVFFGIVIPLIFCLTFLIDGWIVNEKQKSGLERIWSTDNRTYVWVEKGTKKVRE